MYLSSDICHHPSFHREEPPPRELDHQQFQVENDGIYRGIPVYGNSFNGKVAIVAGASGISGAHMLRAMARHPDIWRQVHALSRRPSMTKAIPKIASNISYHCIDLLRTPEMVGDQLQGAQITQCDYVFFFAYVQTEPKVRTALWASAAELAEVNGRLFFNFLEGMKKAGIKPLRVLLQTGGPVMSPNWEDDRRHARTYREPNFYYTQEDILWRYCRENSVEWACCRPGVILGIVEDNALNLVIPLALYAAITKYMGERYLRFPGTRAALEQIHDVGSAVHNGIFMEWQMLAPQTANQIFNLNDGTPFSWLRFWDWFSNLFGLEWQPPLEENNPTAQWKTYKNSEYTPPVGYGQPATCKYSFTLVDWVQRMDVREAWAEMTKKFDLHESAIDMEFSWAMANWAMCRWWNVNLGMAKARKYGYFGAVDWTETLAVALEEAAVAKIIPRIEDLRSQA